MEEELPSPLKTGVVLSDERVDFLRELAFCFLRVKTDKWNRFIGAEENQKILLDFLGNIWTNRLFFSTGPGGTLHAGDAEVRTKILCVRKKGALQGVCKQLVCMQVLVCVLSKDLNQKDWPPVVCEDILRHLERLRRNVVTLRGQAEGRTLLPLPLFVERASARWPLDHGLVYSIETLIVQWSGQIWNVLKKDSGALLLQGDHPGPNVELQFWATQRENLLGIQSQIQSSKVQRIMEILERAKSSYYLAFKDICVKVNEAVLEAEDIDLYLRPLRRLISNLEEKSFPKVDTLLPPLFHTLCLIWTHSQYYCTPRRMVVLLQEFCNLIIEKVFAYLIPEQLFKMEIEEGMERVQICISVMRTFKELFHIYRQKIPSYYKEGQTVKSWDFSETLVFKRLDGIIERLQMIEEVFATALDFLQLEKLELGETRGGILSEMVYSMNEEFHDQWRTLRESKYNPFDYTNDNPPSVFPQLQYLADHVQRGSKQLQVYFGSTQRKSRRSCKYLKSNTKLQADSAVLGKNMPKVAGNLKWSQELRSRILQNRNNLCQMAHL
uniref:Dynein heavy chain tail domain-containing protein n=1 Tax=Oryzias latipes TaxID=8090 RepID=A0A3B3HN46_ORYLA